MKKTILIVFFCIMFFVFAEDKSIYVGDPIKIKIANTDMSTEQIRDAFSAFKIDKIEKSGEVFEVEFRSFDTGEKIVKIGKKNLKIVVKSLVTEKTKDIIDNNSPAGLDGKPLPLDLKEPKFAVPYTILLVILILVIIGTVIFLVFYFSNRKKAMNIRPYQEFMKIANGAETGDELFFTLTYAFKRYMDLRFSHKILGKTSSEILEEVKENKELANELSNLKEWFDYADMVKFAGLKPSEREKIDKKNVMIELVSRINDINIDVGVKNG